MSSEPASRAPKGTAPATSDDGDEAASALERAGAGDRDALMWLYDRFAPSLMAVALRITGSRAEAEEVVQDVMVRAWREAGSFDRTRGSAAAWIVTLGRNRAIDVVRARGRRNAHEAGASASVSEAPATPERAVSESQRADAVRRALSVLTHDQRRALDLAYFTGLSHSEIAEELGQPLGTVKTRIAQAVRRLREELARFAPGGEPSSD